MQRDASHESISQCRRLRTGFGKTCRSFANLWNMRSPSHYLLLDPHHPYAVHFIERLHRKYGHLAICAFTDRRERLLNEASFPQLRGPGVAATYDVDPAGLDEFAQLLKSRHRVIAAIPFNETVLLPTTTIAARLGLGWAQPAVMALFRDKYALKEHLRRADPGLRVGASRRVRTGDEVLSSRGAAYRRFVLKPNDGYGNRQIGIFDDGSPESEIAAYLDRMRGSAVVMEEYIDGTEYFVNGQIDGKGNAAIVGIFEYDRRPCNGRTNLDFETRRVAHGTQRFAELAGYAERVMRATGLKRSPFHLELKTDADGPCLIEVGARLAGLGNALLCGELHGARLDLIDLAGHYYLQEGDYGPLPLDWENYDSQAVRYVHGIAATADTIYDVEGIDAVESLAEFHQWVKKPVVGMRIERTVDSLSMPWSLLLKAPTEARADAAAAEVRRLVRWNGRTGPATRAAQAAKFKLQRGVAKLRRMALLASPRIGGNAPLRRAVALTARAQNALVRRWQVWGFDRGRFEPTPSDPNAAPPAPSAESDRVLEWVREFLARPHPDLGRKGPICPFVAPTIRMGCLKVQVIEDLDGSSMRELRRVVLSRAAAFLRDSPAQGPHGTFASVVLVFPNLRADRLGMLDQIHGELKTFLMCRDLMFSPFHPDSSKPSISNDEFRPFRAPFAALVIRHLDVRDISFMSFSREAFLRYHTRFAAEFDLGRVRDDFGHVRLYRDACRRFGFAAPELPAAAPAGPG